jgi:hypothetical protein
MLQQKICLEKLRIQQVSVKKVFLLPVSAGIYQMNYADLFQGAKKV